MTTIASLFKDKQVPFDVLHKQYKPVLLLVEQLIGVVPNCDPLLEIWPPGFRTYNLIVPNLLNFPKSLFINKPLKALVGLTTYASSRAADCPYCAAHTCSFALRRGLDPEKITGNRSPKEAISVKVAEALSRIPHELTKDQCAELSQHLSPYEEQWVILGIVAFGFLNKFMDAMGVPLEEASLQETGKLLENDGWTPGQHVDKTYKTPRQFTKPKVDSIGRYFRIIKQAPGAVRLENKWVKGVPNSYPNAGIFLLKNTGFDFPMLAHIKGNKVVRALTTALRDNLDAKKTKIGLGTKSMAGLVFATIAQNKTLLQESMLLIKHHAPSITDSQISHLQEKSLDDNTYDRVSCHAYMDDLATNLDVTKKQAAAITIAKAAAYSPAQFSPVILDEAVALLAADEVVELITWISVQQLLHRLYTYFEVVKGI